MVDAAIQSELLKEVEQLPLPMQQRVLDYARSLHAAPAKEAQGKGFLSLAGCMTPEEGEEFLRAIEEDCERIDPNEW
jgi:hypothetical protein